MSNRRRKRTENPQASASPTPQRRLDHLVLIRESDNYGRLLMEGMIQQTLAKVQHLPGATELKKAGVRVFTEPERWGATLRRSGSSQMATVEVEGVLYLYSMGTAAKNDLPDTNAFVAELVKIIATYRPAEVWTVAFTRLLRSAEYVGDLLKVFSEHTQVLHCEAEIRPATPEGKMVFQVLGMIAAVERDYIVRRHTAGRVSQWRRRDWIPNAYPPGYRVEDGHLVLAPNEIEATRQMLAIMATPGLTPAEKALRIGALGLSTPMITRIHGDEATIADARNPSDVIDTLMGWVDTYDTGRYDVLWPNPFPGVEEFAGVEVEDLEGYEYGALRLRYEVPIPGGGWADDSTFEAIRQNRSTLAPTGGASHRTVPPLSGLFSFVDGSYEYAIVGRGDHYQLVRRPHEPLRQFTGWTCEVNDSEWITTVSRREWHKSIADAVAEALRHGLPADLDPTRFQSIDTLPPLNPRRARIRILRKQLADVTDNLERARRNARLAGDDDAATLFVEDVKRYLAEHRFLTGELEELDDDDPQVLGDSFESSAELVAQALGRLSRVELAADASLRDALRTVISKERWWLDDELVHWEIFLEVPHNEGTAVLGPISGTLNRYAGGKRRPTRRRIRRASALSLIELGLGERAAMTVSACPSPLLGEVLTAHLTGQPTPEGTDADWAKTVIETYTDPAFRWQRGHWRLGDTERVRVLTLVADAGGTLRRSQILGAGVAPHQLRYLTRQTDAPSGDPILTRLTGEHDAKHELIRCPHCGAFASHSVVTPETRPGLLCSQCWRAPRPDSPVFPDFYRVSFDDELPVAS